MSWQTLVEARRRLFLAAAERYGGLPCLLLHAGPDVRDKLSSLPSRYKKWKRLAEFGLPDGPMRRIFQEHPGCPRPLSRVHASRLCRDLRHRKSVCLR